MVKICMVEYSYFPGDTRVRKEVEALLEKGHKIDIICLKGRDERYEKWRGARVYRLPIERKVGGFATYIFRYSYFFLFSMFKLLSLWLREKYNVVHVHNPPDFLVFIALPLKLFETKVVLDIHDPMPELFASRFERGMDSPIVKIMTVIEKISCAFADEIITVSDVVKRNLIDLGIPENKIHVVMNTPDERLFTEERRRVDKGKFGLEDKYVILYEGVVLKRRGLHTVLEALKLLEGEIPNIHFVVMGDGDFLPELKKRVEALRLNGKVSFLGRRPLEEVPEYITVSDVCVIPFIDAPINQIGVPNKLFEYMMYDKPIIASHLNGISSIVSENEAWFFEPENANALARVISNIYYNGSKTKTSDLGKILQKCSWETMKQRLYRCYEE
jgi:glycosyltransferase involved in cell wall biosynthesis